MSVEFEDNRVKVKKAIDQKIKATLEECAAEIESQTKRNTRVDTGKTKNSWRHIVIGNTAYIGSFDINAVYEEFGTGDYALKGDGRKGGWVYKSDKDGKYYHTNGKRPSRAFWKAYSSLKSPIINKLKNMLKGL